MTKTPYPRLAISLLLAAALSACDKPGPAESAGKAIDQTATDVGKKMSETADKVDKKLSEAGEKTAAVISDTEITSQVKAAIFAEPGLDSLKITVDTRGGTVTLSGTVDTEAHGERARTLAAKVSGVNNVVNRLTTVPNK
ncbi:MAG: Transport-associated protein [Proteobacteria bacterium]|nr:Transport-associated protein [Pseudomonadota bacterium]